jgi:hypothetical protein
MLHNTQSNMGNDVRLVLGVDCETAKQHCRERLADAERALQDTRFVYIHIYISIYTCIYITTMSACIAVHCICTYMCVYHYTTASVAHLLGTTALNDVAMLMMSA